MITVPERIIEHHTVIRETVIEPVAPVTIINITPVTNVSTQIITIPGNDPPAAQTEEIIVVSPPAPPAPVIPTDPAPVEPTLPPWQPETCPAPWMMIDVVGYGKIAAGELKPGMYARTYHEHTMDYGQYEVTHVESIQDAERIQIEFEHVDFVCSLSHKFYKDGEWIAAEDLEVGDMVGFTPNEYEVLGISTFDDGEVIKISVAEAHTYVCEGILSHNKPPTLDPPIPDPPNLPISFEFDPWWSIIPRNPFMFGGSFDGNSWFPYVPVQPLEQINTTIESANPTVSQPIILGNEFGGGVSGFTDAQLTGGGGRGDLDDFNYDRN